MADFSQRTLGYARDALYTLQGKESFQSYPEQRDFWKKALFDAGFPARFIEVASSYSFKWTDIIPDLYIGKFAIRNQHFADAVPAGIGEQFLKRLVDFAVGVSTQTPLGNKLVESLEADGFPMNSAELPDTPAELTKLPDKSLLLSKLDRHIRDASLVALLFIDLDNFKLVNDRHGHSEGDRCLVEIVACLRDAVLGKGSLYRVGGDEFCVLLPNFSIIEAAATGERIRGSVNALAPFGGTTHVTTSIGAAASDRPELTNAESLYDAADKAMYSSKRTKNRVTVWVAFG